MSRLRAIAFALHLAAPHWHPQHETAVELLRLEQRWHVRAELVIADAEHESRWQERAINPTSGALGLMQVMPLRGDDITRSELLTWRLNLRRGVAVFALARDYCKAKGRGSKAKTWLWLPTGWDAVSRAECGYRNGKKLPTPKGIAWLLKRMKEISK